MKISICKYCELWLYKPFRYQSKTKMKYSKILLFSLCYHILLLNQISSTGKQHKHDFIGE